MARLPILEILEQPEHHIVRANRCSLTLSDDEYQNKYLSADFADLHRLKIAELMSICSNITNQLWAGFAFNDFNLRPSA